MDIKRIEKYKKQVIELQELKDRYAYDYKSVSELYWPRYDQIKKKLKDRSYMIGLCICLLAVISFSTIFGGLKNEYLIGGCFGITGILLTLAIIYFLKMRKIAKAFHAEWKVEEKKLEDIQNNIRTLHDDMVEEILRIICFNKYHYNDNEVDINEWDKNYSLVREEVMKETSDSLAYEDVLGYFTSWVENF